MLYSMTGYGRAEQSVNNRKILVEIRSLNSKNFDVRMKLPDQYKSKELEIRRLINDKLLRGKIDISLNILNTDGSAYSDLDKRAISRYYNELIEVAEELGADKAHILPTVIQLPNVISTDSGDLGTEEWEVAYKCIKDALSKVNNFREIEGDALRSDLRQRIILILSHLDKIYDHEDERQNSLKLRLQKHMNEFKEKEDFNNNRYEQEILYYMEKLDITEERVRLRQHCDYFLDILMNKNSEKGRKLNFISQEMGREINTLGAKANFSNIQHIVVLMKNELEKVKEQVANVV